MENLLEVNIKLKEDIALLEKMYGEMLESYIFIYNVPSMIHCNLKMLSMMCSEQIKAQNGEESFQIKFGSVEKFAEILGLMINMSLDYLEDKYNIK